MSYEKQNFKDGQVLTAEQLNRMEEGIETAGGGGTFVITLADDGKSVDKSVAEIKDAYESGKVCILRRNSSVYQMTGAYLKDDGEWNLVVFSLISATDGGSYFDVKFSDNTINIYADGSIRTFTSYLTLEYELSTSGSGAIQNSVVATKFEELEESLTETFGSIANEIQTVTPLLDMVKIDGTDVLEIPSDITGNPSIMDMLYLVSDSTPTMADLSGGVVVTIDFNGVEQEVQVPSEGVMELYGLIAVTINGEVPLMFINPIDNFTNEEVGLVVPNKGVYVAPIVNDMPVKKIKINGYVFGKRVIKGENIEFVLNSSTEGSTKKFKITVDDSGTVKATEITE